MAAPGSPVWRADVRKIRPMLAMLEDAPLCDESLVYEPKYDGIRGLVELDPAGRSPTVRIWSRLGNEKTAQFPELIDAFSRYARHLKGPVLLDGEIVALDEHAEPAGFQKLQGRIHLTEGPHGPQDGQVAFIAFDVLRDRDEDLTVLPLVTRRARLERIFGNARSPILRLSDVSAGDGRAMYQRALERGWEGIIAKRADSLYQPGKRTPDWRKLKIVRQQEFVVGGWTESRTARRPFGALLLGYYDNGGLMYAGHTGSGFNERELDRVWRLLKPLEISTCPFNVRPRTNERPHWTQPKLVAQLKFGEWTDENRLRQPIYLGLRDDVRPEKVRREPDPSLHPSSARATEEPIMASPASPKPVPANKRRASSPSKGRRVLAGSLSHQTLITALEEIERGRGSARIVLPDGSGLDVTNLSKMFWPKLKISKGDLLRYYVRIHPLLLPVVADRPLIMKRFPNGVDGKAFYQQRAPDPVPADVRTATLPNDDVPSRLIGGSLRTLLYMAQLAVISQDPWFSRIQSVDFADHTAIDLDPMPGVSFAAVLDVARWVHEELDHLGVEGYPKTSGADGLHIYIPLRRGTPYEAGMLFCQIVATVVATKHPKLATVARSVSTRGKTVYVDYLQNIQGKSLACAYSARASEYAGASTPLTWAEIDRGVDRRDFTIRTLPQRVEEVGDLWAPLLASKGVDLRAVEKYGKK